MAELFLPFPEGLGLGAVLTVAAAVPGLELKLLALDADGGAGGDGVGDEHIGADDAVPADDRTAAQNGCTGIDGHIVFNGGMTLFALQALAAPGGQCAQGHALVDLYMVADDGGLTHNDAGAVVNEEILADGGAGMEWVMNTLEPMTLSRPMTVPPPRMEAPA